MLTATYPVLLSEIYGYAPFMPTLLSLKQNRPESCHALQLQITVCVKGKETTKT